MKNDAALAAQERARLDNGRFGRQPRTDAGPAVLAVDQPKPLTVRVAEWLTRRTFCENLVGDNDDALWQADNDAAELADELAVEHADDPYLEELIQRWRHQTRDGYLDGDASLMLRRMAERLGIDPDDDPHCLRCGDVTEGEAVCRECGLGDPAFRTRYAMEAANTYYGRRNHDRVAEWLAECTWHQERDNRQGFNRAFVSMQRDALDLIEDLASFEEHHPVADPTVSRTLRVSYESWVHGRSLIEDSELARKFSDEEGVRVLKLYAEALGIRPDTAPRCTETGRSINSPYRCGTCDGCRSRS